MKILHISTHNENCGIGKYQEMYLQAMRAVDTGVQQDFFPYSPNQIRVTSQTDLATVYTELRQTILDYDIVHIQHEFSFFRPEQLTTIVKIIKDAHKPLVSTIHTKPIIRKTTRPIFTPKGILARIIDRAKNTQHIKHVSPLSVSDLVFVHNTFTQQGLIEIGFFPNKIKLIPIPVPEVPEKVSDPYQKQLAFVDGKIDRQPNDIVIATVGYINEMKGTLRAVKALSLLPGNYKLYVFGGMHPQGSADDFLDFVSDYIVQHNLQKRVYITGFVADDDLLNAYVGHADIVVFPYAKSYPSSSAALNNGFANHKPIIATPVTGFKEINANKPYIALTDSFSYYDLAKKIVEFDASNMKKQQELSIEYAIENSYPKLAAVELADYKALLA
jgi:glycosyltransferase involved in cell wall biosynthesis